VNPVSTTMELKEALAQAAQRGKENKFFCAGLPGTLEN